MPNESVNVRLRPLQIRDIDTWLRWMNDPEVTKYLGQSGRTYRRADLEMYWALAHGSRSDRLYAVEAEDGKLIGLVTLHKIPRDLSRCELGIVIGEKDYWGKGLGSAAVAKALKIAFDELHLNSVALRVAASNARAVASYERAGFSIRHRFHHRFSIDGRPDDELFMAIDAQAATTAVR